MQYSSKSCNFGSMVAVLAVSCVSVLLYVLILNKVSLDMI